MVDEKVLSHGELEKAFQDAAKKGDYKLVRELAKKLEESEKAQATAERDIKLKALADTTLKVKQAIDKVVQKFVDAKDLDIADGVWYSYDFGEELTTCRLMKSAPRKAGTGSSTGSYISRPEKSSELLAKVGSNVMFKEATAVTIDKVEQTMKAGTTFRQAYDFSTMEAGETE